MSQKSSNIEEKDSESPWRSGKLPNLAEDWENQEKFSNEEDLLEGIDQMASENNPLYTDNALINFQANQQIQNVNVMKHEIQRGRMKLKERREIITIFNDEMLSIIKTISTHTRRIVENSLLGAIMGKYDPWLCEKRVDIKERSTTGQRITREVSMTLSSPEELQEFEKIWDQLLVPKQSVVDVAS